MSRESQKFCSKSENLSTCEFVINCTNVTNLINYDRQESHECRKCHECHVVFNIMPRISDTAKLTVTIHK